MASVRRRPIRLSFRCQPIRLSLPLPGHCWWRAPHRPGFPPQRGPRSCRSASTVILACPHRCTVESGRPSPWSLESPFCSFSEKNKHLLGRWWQKKKTRSWFFKLSRSYWSNLNAIFKSCCRLELNKTNTDVCTKIATEVSISVPQSKNKKFQNITSDNTGWKLQGESTFKIMVIFILGYFCLSW